MTRFVLRAIGLERLAVLLCCIATFLPVLLFRFFQSQDGGTHAYSAWALHRMHEGSPLFLEYFRPTTPLTNWAATAILEFVRFATPPGGLERGFVLVYLALVIAAILFTTCRLLRLPIGFAVLFFPLVFSHMLHMGSFNVALAYVAFVPFVGLAYRYVSHPSPRGAALVGAMLLVIFMLHVQIVLVALAYVAICALWMSARSRGGSDVSRPAGGFRLREAIWLGLAGLPAAAMCGVFALQSTAMENHIYHAGLNKKLLQLLKLNGIASYSLFSLVLAIALCAAMVGTAVFVSLKARQASRAGSPEVAPSAATSILLGGVGILLLLVVAPNGFDDADNVEERLMIPMLIAFAAWLALRLQASGTSPRAVALAGLVFVLLQSADRTHAFSRLDPILAEYSEVSAGLPDGAAVLLVDLDDVAAHHTHRSIGRPFAVVTRFDPARTFLGNVLSNREVIYVNDYEAARNKPYFALKYQPWLAAIMDNRVMDDVAGGERSASTFATLAETLPQATAPIRYLAVWGYYPESYDDPGSAAFLRSVHGAYHEVFSSSRSHMRLYLLN